MRARKQLRGLAPYLLVLPGWLWMVVFFIVPCLVMLSLSTQSGDLVSGFRQTLHFQNYVDAWSQYHVQFTRSILYGVTVSALCLVVGYPVAYWIAFRGGSRKSSLLLLVLLPFFVSFVVRAVSWNNILADNGILLSLLTHLHIVDPDFHFLSTPGAVIAGLTYNFMPFMVLPIYVALERVDRVLLEAAADLYASWHETFLRVVFPLSLPGVFAGVLLTFVPATADFVNASILGGTNTTMIGNIIQTQYFTNSNYPMASALGIILMGTLLLGVFAYAKALGTREVLDMAAS